MRGGYPFSVFKPTDKPNYYVAFKNEKTGQYLPAISTRTPEKGEAFKVALEWYKNGVPKKGQLRTIKQYSLLDVAKKSDLTQFEVESILKELQRKGFLKSYILNKSKQDRAFSEYLLSFWDYETSPYIQEKLRKHHGIHRRYCDEQLGIVKKYWIPYFKEKLLGEVSREDLESFINNLEKIASRGDKVAPKSSKRKNTIIKAGTIPLSWAHQREIVDKDVSSGIVLFAGDAAKRQIPTPEVATAIFRQQWKDKRWKVANMLAMVTGLRAGEIQGLRVKDLGDGFLHIRHSWNSIDGLKTTKNNEERIVEVPFPFIMDSLAEFASLNPHGEGEDGYIFFSTLPGKPIEAMVFLDALRDALIKAGMRFEEAKGYTFHGWRHYFTAYMRERVTERVLQKQTGHKTLEMLDHYAAHELKGEKERLRKAQVETFGAMIPEANDLQDFSA